MGQPLPEADTADGHSTRQEHLPVTGGNEGVQEVTAAVGGGNGRA